MDDLNGHQLLWNSKTTNDKGKKKLKDFLSQEVLCICCSNANLHPPYGTYSAIDITVTDPPQLDLSCKVREDLVEVIMFMYF